MFCGIDWASERHAVCVLDDAGKTISAFQVAHTADGLEQLVATLRRYGDPAGLPVAIERPDGRLVDRLLRSATRSSLSNQARSRPGGTPRSARAPRTTPATRR